MLLADKRMRENSKGMDSSKDLRVWNSKSALVGLVGGKEDVPKQKGGTSCLARRILRNKIIICVST